MKATDNRASLRFTLRLGFTLVELLVVITVIAILIALLLPALGKAEQQAKQVACLANMRDLGLAMVMYSQTNRYFPGPAAAGVEINWDWIFWQPDRNIKNSAIAPYLVQRGVNVDPSVFICPADVYRNDRSATMPGTYPYPYSYSVNCLLTNPRMGEWWQEYQQDFQAKYGAWPTASQITNYFGPPPYPNLGEPNSVNFSGVTLPYNQVVSPSNLIMIVDESEITIDDGYCVLPWGNTVSTRHWLGGEHAPDPSIFATYYQTDLGGKGNVVFADGHAAYVTRFFTEQQSHWDPWQ